MSILGIRVSDFKMFVTKRPERFAFERKRAEETRMDTAERFIHQKIDSAVACQIADADIAAPRLSIGFV